MRISFKLCIRVDLIKADLVTKFETNRATRSKVIGSNWWKLWVFWPENHVFQVPKLEIRMRMSSNLQIQVELIKADLVAKFEANRTSRSKVMGPNVWKLCVSGAKLRVKKVNFWRTWFLVMAYSILMGRDLLFRDVHINGYNISKFEVNSFSRSDFRPPLDTLHLWKKCKIWRIFSKSEL